MPRVPLPRLDKTGQRPVPGYRQRIQATPGSFGAGDAAELGRLGAAGAQLGAAVTGFAVTEFKRQDEKSFRDNFLSYRQEVDDVVAKTLDLQGEEALNAHIAARQATELMRQRRSEQMGGRARSRFEAYGELYANQKVQTVYNAVGRKEKLRVEQTQVSNAINTVTAAGMETLQQIKRLQGMEAVKSGEMMEEALDKAIESAGKELETSAQKDKFEAATKSWALKYVLSAQEHEFAQGREAQKTTVLSENNLKVNEAILHATEGRSSSAESILEEVRLNTLALYPGDPKRAATAYQEQRFSFHVAVIKNLGLRKGFGAREAMKYIEDNSEELNKNMPLKTGLEAKYQTLADEEWINQVANSHYFSSESKVLEESIKAALVVGQRVGMEDNELKEIERRMRNRANQDENILGTRAKQHQLEVNQGVFDGSLQTFEDITSAINAGGFPQRFMSTFLQQHKERLEVENYRTQKQIQKNIKDQQEAWFSHSKTRAKARIKGLPKEYLRQLKSEDEVDLAIVNFEAMQAQNFDKLRTLFSSDRDEFVRQMSNPTLSGSHVLSFKQHNILHSMKDGITEPKAKAMMKAMDMAGKQFKAYNKIENVQPGDKPDSTRVRDYRRWETHLARMQTRVAAEIEGIIKSNPKIESDPLKLEKAISSIVNIELWDTAKTGEPESRELRMRMAMEAGIPTTASKTDRGYQLNETNLVGIHEILGRYNQALVAPDAQGKDSDIISLTVDQHGVPLEATTAAGSTVRYKPLARRYRGQ